MTEKGIVVDSSVDDEDDGNADAADAAADDADDADCDDRNGDDDVDNEAISMCCVE